MSFFSMLKWRGESIPVGMNRKRGTMDEKPKISFNSVEDFLILLLIVFLIGIAAGMVWRMAQVG